MIVVFDIDGTLSIVGERLVHLKADPPQWRKFYARCGEDEVNEPIAMVMRLMLNDPSYHVIVLTGREEAVRSTTARWLMDNGLGNYDALLMRKVGDYRHDTLVKPELLKGYLSAYFPAYRQTPDLIFEDRNSMVEHWRKLGFCCAQVAPGDF